MTIHREITLDNSARWELARKFIEGCYKALADAGTPLRIIITNSKKKRNEEQNKRYFKAIIEPIVEQVWIDGRRFSKKAWHETYAEKFGYFEEIAMPDGTNKLRRKSTTEYNVQEFSDYMMNVEADAAQEFGVRFPEYVK